MLRRQYFVAAYQGVETFRQQRFIESSLKIKVDGSPQYESDKATSKISA
jgi:hypothetical protein